VIDSHCHLAGEEFAADLDEVVGRATAAGISGALVIVGAEDDDEYERAAAVTRAWPGARLSIGVHPHTAGQFAADPAAAATLVEARLAGRPAARAIGEIGLDYHYDFAPREVQQAVFREQIGLARRLRLPIVIHTREAEEDTFSILADTSAGDARDGAPGARLGIPPLPCGDRDLSARHRTARSREAGAARSPADRDRQPVSRAGSPSRHAQ
jgi:TatD DNase family protein